MIKSLLSCVYNFWLQTTWKNITIPGIAKVYPPKTVITMGCNGIHTKVHILKNVVAQTTLDLTDCCYIDEIRKKSDWNDKIFL